MAVDDEDLLETVVGDALGDVNAEGDEGFRFDMDGAGKVDVVQIQSVGDRGQHEDPVCGPAADLQTDRFAQEQIDIEREMLAVLFVRTGGQDDKLLGRNRVVHLGPGETVVAVLGLGVRRHFSSSVGLWGYSPRSLASSVCRFFMDNLFISLYVP